MATSSKDYTDLVDATQDLKQRGYTSDFKIIDTPGSEDEDAAEPCQLESLSTGKVYTANQLKIRSITVLRVLPIREICLWCMQ
jgi:hypothetical protein